MRRKRRYKRRRNPSRQYRALNGRVYRLKRRNPRVNDRRVMQAWMKASGKGSLKLADILRKRWGWKKGRIGRKNPLSETDRGRLNVLMAKVNKDGYSALSGTERDEFGKLAAAYSERDTIGLNPRRRRR